MTYPTASEQSPRPRGHWSPSPRPRFDPLFRLPCSHFTKHPHVCVHRSIWPQYLRRTCKTMWALGFGAPTSISVDCPGVAHGRRIGFTYIRKVGFSFSAKPAPDCLKKIGEPSLPKTPSLALVRELLFCMNCFPLPTKPCRPGLLSGCASFVTNPL